MTSLDLANLFSGEDFRWQMRFERGELKGFFSAGTDAERVLSERQKWLAVSPEKYTALLPAGVALLDETIDIAQDTGALTEQDGRKLINLKDPQTRLLHLGGLWEADFCLLGRDENNQLVLQAGVVCFPSHWSLPDKIGKPMHAIHSPVPQLNEIIGRQIDLFLEKLKPGVVWLRSNWGISASAELNQHPDRKLPRLVSPVRLDEAFLRIERQALLTLPRSKGVLFGIRIEQLSLAEVKQDATVTANLVHGLRTMDENIAAYKGFGATRGEIIALLE